MARKLTPKQVDDATDYFGEEVLKGTVADGKWSKGKSGNPAGRPKEPEPGEDNGLIDMLIWRLGRTGSKAIADKLIELAKDGDLDAIKYIYDRIEGRPRQAIVKETKEEPLLVQLLRKITDDQSALAGQPLLNPGRPVDTVIEAEVREVTGEGTGA